MNERNVQRGNGTFSFNGSISNEAFADYLLGRPNSVIQQSLAEIGLRQKYVGYIPGRHQAQSAAQRALRHALGPSLPEHDVAGRGNTFSMADFLAGKKSSLYNNSPAGLLFYGDREFRRPMRIPGTWISRRDSDLPGTRLTR